MVPLPTESGSTQLFPRGLGFDSFPSLGRLVLAMRFRSRVLRGAGVEDRPQRGQPFLIMSGQLHDASGLRFRRELLVGA